MQRCREQDGKGYNEPEVDTARAIGNAKKKCTLHYEARREGKDLFLLRVSNCPLRAEFKLYKHKFNSALRGKTKTARQSR